MTPTHPNRSKQKPKASRNPSPDDVRAARHAVNLTQKEAAETVHCSLTAWQDWEYGKKRMHPAFFDLFLLKTGQRLLAVIGNGGTKE